MTIVKHNPTQFNHLIDELFTGIPTAWGRNNSGFTAPPTNIHETSDAYHLEMNVPGRNKEDFSIQLEKGLLTIGYEKKEATVDNAVKTIRREFSFNSFKRSFSIDEKINTAGIQAKYENGVLKLLLPKKEEVVSHPQAITIQ